MHQLEKMHPKAEPINNAIDGVYMGNSRFTLIFQDGPIDPHGTIKGALEEEVLAVLIYRANKLGQLDLVDALTDALVIALEHRNSPEDPTDVLLAEAATDVPSN